MARTCPECSSTELYESVIPTSWYFPILAGLGSLLRPSRLKVVLCSDCGLVRQYASEEARINARTVWQRHKESITTQSSD